ncbi:hypothetical protein WA026_004875 [Henosepilachna vigintioctopunctata]|uniref:Uncharacterized protein n=1 Tax=Henosepilachna vigintioctopunctata TaxID=420089 RepID=A0AAW1US94_9CUCU
MAVFPNTAMDNYTSHISEVIKTWNEERMTQAKEAIQFLKSLEREEAVARNSSEGECSDIEIASEATQQPRTSRKRRAAKTPPLGNPTEIPRRRKTSEPEIAPTETQNRFEILQNLETTEPSTSEFTTTTEPAACANCGGPHPANYKGCAAYHTAKPVARQPQVTRTENPLANRTAPQEKPTPPPQKPTTSGLNYTQALKGKTAPKPTPAAPKTPPKPAERTEKSETFNMGKMFDIFSNFNIEKFKAVLKKMSTLMANATTMPEIMIGIFQCMPDICESVDRRRVKI